MFFCHLYTISTAGGKGQVSWSVCRVQEESTVVSVAQCHSTGLLHCTHDAGNWYYIDCNVHVIIHTYIILSLTCLFLHYDHCNYSFFIAHLL